MVSKARLDQAWRDTWQVYQRNARQFDRDRNRKLFEKPCLDRFLNPLPAGGTILDLGCGGGEPIAAYFIENGFQVTGIDYAEAMIEIARQRFPDHDWQVQDMRQLELGSRFDGVISWNGFFHLSQDEQRQVLPTLAGLVEDRGSLLLTVGHYDGEVSGTVAGEMVYHASLGEEEYRAILSQAGFGEIDFRPQDPECHSHSILMARRG